MSSSLRSRLKALEGKLNKRDCRSGQEAEADLILQTNPAFKQLCSNLKQAVSQREKDEVLGQMLREAVVTLFGDSSPVDPSDFLYLPPGWTEVST